MAITGEAASIMKGGATCHHTLSIKVGSTSDHPTPLRPEKLTSIRDRLKRESLAMIIIDEISFVSAEMFAIIEERVTEIMGAKFNPETGEKLAFGGLPVILLGDFFQLPPVGNDSLFTSAMNLFGRGNVMYSTSSKKMPLKSEMRELGTRLFSQFKKIELTEVILIIQLNNLFHFTI